MSIATRNRLRMTATTGCARNIDQLLTLCDLVPAPKRVYVFACSNGIEAYTAAMFYDNKEPPAVPQVMGFDVDGSLIARARQATYSVDELFYQRDPRSTKLVNHFLGKYFEKTADDSYTLRDSIRSRCTFNAGSILDPQFMRGMEPADVVLCQNVLVHMTDAQNEQALRLLIPLVRPDGVLAIGGMRLDVRERITQALGLVPVTANCREIHEGQQELRRFWDTSSALTRPYYAMPPFEMTRNWEYRFSTLFRVANSDRR